MPFPGIFCAGISSAKRFEHEAALQEVRVRHDQTRLVDRLVAVEEEVEVDRPRPPARPDPLAAEPALDVEQVVEQLPRREHRLELGRCVQEARLVLVAPRLALADRRETDGADQLGRLSDQRLAVAEVRAEADVGEDHGRVTVTALNSTVRPAGRTSGLRTRTRTDSGPNRSSSVSATADASASSRS